MEIFVFCLTVAVICAAYLRLPAGHKDPTHTSLFRLTFADAAALGVPVILALYLYAPIIARVPEDHRLLQTFAPDFSRQAVLVQEMIDRGAFDLNIPAQLASRNTDGDIAFDSREVNCWRYGYGASAINLSIAAGRLVGVFKKTSYGLAARIQLVVLFLGLIVSMVLLYLWGRAIAGPLCGFFAAATYLLPYKVSFLIWTGCSPDHIQQALLIGCILCCVILMQTPNLRAVFLASLLAGLAFGTKFGGMVLFPLIAAAPFVSTEGRRRFGSLSSVVALFLVIGLASLLGVIVSNPQALLHPSYAAAGILHAVRMHNFSSYFANGMLKVFSNVFWVNFLNYDLWLLILIVAGCILFASRYYSDRQLPGTFWGGAAVAWGVLYSAFLFVAVRYPEPGIFMPIWPVLSLMAAFGLVEFGRRISLLGGRPISIFVVACLALGMAFHEARASNSALAILRVNLPIIFNLDNPFYAPVRDLAQFMRLRYSPSARIICDYAHIYVPVEFRHVVYTWFAFMGRDTERIIDLADVVIISRSDDEFQAALLEGHYDREQLVASRKVYEEIRSGAKFRKVLAMDYPPGWLSAKVEVWERQKPVAHR